MMKYSCWNPDGDRKPHRWDAFRAGLEACGYREARPESLGGGDIFVTWNRHAGKDAMIRHIEIRGVRICVVENAYVGSCDERLYAIGWGDHATFGNCRVGADDRWIDQGIACRPWRHDGRDVVIIGQRGIGRPPVASPSGWEHKVAAELSRQKRPVRIRHHPGKDAPRISLETDLDKAWCVVTWASSAAIRAIVMGVPCFHGYRDWIGRQASQVFGYQGIESPWRPDRAAMLQTISHAQWRESEIAMGMPFR